MLSRLDYLHVLVSRMMLGTVRPLEQVLVRDVAVRNHTTRYGGFPVKVRVVGAEHVQHAMAAKRGILFCGVHLPGCLFTLNALVELGVRVAVVVGDEGGLEADGSFPVLGSERKVPRVAPGTAAMLKARRALRDGGCVATMLDSNIDGKCASLMPRLAGQLGATIVWFWTEWPVGVGVTVHFMRTEDEVCDTDEKVARAMALIEERYQAAVLDLRARL